MRGLRVASLAMRDSERPKKSVVLVALLFGVITSVALSGCTSEDVKPLTPSTDSQNPPSSEFGELMGSCMKESGWEVTVTADLSIYPSDVEHGIPPEQLPQYSKDLQSCLSESGYDVPPDPTDAQLSDLYAGEIETRNCLIDEGYAIPEMPSETTFVSSYGTADGWDVQKYVTPPSSQSDYDKLWAKCPLPAWSANW